MKTKIKTKITFAFLLFIIASACQGGRHMEIASNTVDSGTTRVGNGLYFDSNIEPLFQKRCAYCHNGGSAIPNWMDYETAYERRSRIYQRVYVDKTMPMAPYNQMPETERTLIAQWINDGAPKSQVIQEPNPIPTQVPIPGPVPGQCDSQIDSELISLITAGNIKGVTYLLNHGACADAKTAEGESALILAIGKDFADIAGALIKNGADVNSQFNGGSALIWAELMDDAQVAQNLIEKGADPNSTIGPSTDASLNTYFGYTALMLAIQNINVEQTSMLLSYGAQLDAKTSKGVTAASLCDRIDSRNPKKLILQQLLTSFASQGPLHSPTFSGEILAVFKNRCSMCHNENTPNMNWLDFRTAYNMRSLIFIRAVVRKDMPMNNMTQMTDSERDILGQWIKAGAPK